MKTFWRFLKRLFGVKDKPHNTGYNGPTDAQRHVGNYKADAPGDDPASDDGEVIVGPRPGDR